jgi:dTDP-D-glucose 4,6-dehydratase
MRLLVTGGAGFIGSNFVRYMLQKYPDYRIGVLDALTYAGNLDNFVGLWENPNFQFFQGRIEDPVLVDNLARNVDAIINFAAESHNDRAILDPYAATTTNFSGVLTLLEAARKYKHPRFHQVSCYDKTSRALTKDGLKYFDDIKAGDAILSLNPETGEIEEKLVEKVIIQDYSGPMVRFKSNRVDLMVTPNHRMLFTTPGHPDTIRIETAEELMQRSAADAPRARWCGREDETVTIRDVGTVPTRELFYLAGIFIGDGFVSVQQQNLPNKTGLERAEYLKRCRNEKGHFINPGKVGSQETTTVTCHRIFFEVPEKDKGRRRLEETLNSLGISWTAHRGKAGEHIYFSSEAWATFFAQFGKGAVNKHIPAWMLEYAAPYLKALFDGISDSDGHYPPGKNLPRISTSSERLVCGLMELGFKLGYFPRFSQRTMEAISVLATTGRVIRPNFPAYLVFFRRENIGIEKRCASIEEYTGKIWCLKVADNRNFIVERNGILLFCGNTDEVYGTTDGEFTEGDPLEPNQPYSAAKAGGELLVRAYHVTFGLNTIVTRGSNTFGPFHYPEKIIPLFITNAMEGKTLPVYGDGKQVRDWMWVMDHAAGIDIAFHKGVPGEIYNVGGGNERHNIDVVRLILRYLGKDESLIRYVTDRPGHDRRYSLNTKKIEALGFAPDRDFEARLEETVKWYVDNETWWRKIKESDGYRSFHDKWYANRK